jgi:hypothetical protein
MKTLWCKNQENPSDRISHAWAPLNKSEHMGKKFGSPKCTPKYFQNIFTPKLRVQANVWRKNHDNPRHRKALTWAPLKH